MKITHKLPEHLQRRAINIVVVGAGGTGSAVLAKLAQLHYTLIQLGHPGGFNVTVYDPDTVSESNLLRQTFLKCDLGQNKACLIVNRLNFHYGFSWEAMPVRLNKSDRISPDIIIGCVDTRKSRAAIMGSVISSQAYYIDSGNSENSGQVVLGEIGSPALMKRHDRLPNVADLFPELVNAELDKTDTAPTCSALESLRKQDFVINSSMAIEVINLLWSLLSTRGLNYSGRFVNLKTGMSVPIRMDTDTWARMGYIAPVEKKRRSKKEAVPA